MKKNTMKKLLALLLALAMVFALAACGGNGETPNTGDTSSGDTNSGDTSSGDTSSGDTGSGDTDTGTGHHAPYEAKDMGGRTIKVGMWWDEYYDSRFQTLDDITAAGGTYDDAEIAQMRIDHMREIEEKWNVRLEIVNLGWEGEIDSIATSVINGTPDCDIYLIDPQFGLAPAASGYAMKLSEIAPADSDVLNGQEIFTRFNVFGSDDYLFNVSTGIPQGLTYLAYNADMLDEMNLERPEDLAARGEWTWDKFAEYCSILTRDTDNDGNTDVYGYGNTARFTMEVFPASNNATVAASLTEGLTDNKTVETFNFIDRLYNVDGTAKPYTGDWGEDTEPLFRNEVAFSCVPFYLIAGNQGTSEFELRICPAPIGPSGDGSMIPTQFGSYYLIPVGVEDPTAVYEIWEEFANWFDYDMSLKENPSWFESGFVDEEQLELAYEIGSKTPTSDFWPYCAGVFNVWDNVIGNKSMTVSQAIETFKQVAQDDINNLAGVQ